MAKNWIDGQWVSSGDLRASFDPATGQQIGTYAHASSEDVQRAFAAAARCPMIDKANVERVNRVVKEAIADGARVVVRGGPGTEGPLADGAFYRPTLLEVDDSNMRIVQHEVFGPVRASPTTIVPIPNWRTSPLQYQHGDRVVTMTVSR
jgi:acyl-CoA reductase-like NAD-dependent aldehyde dehydrogenase